jgi:hypothetical protein
MASPETKSALADGVHIAWQSFGSGAVDLVYVPGWFSNVSTFNAAQVSQRHGAAPGEPPVSPNSVTARSRLTASVPCPDQPMAAQVALS